MRVITTPLELFTFGQLVTETGLEPHQVRYILSSRKIQPSGRLSHLYLWSRDDIEEIKLAAEVIAQRGSGRPTPLC